MIDQTRAAALKLADLLKHIAGLAAVSDSPEQEWGPKPVF